MYSQGDEERVILEWFDDKPAGRFLDVGAYDGKAFSNTRALFDRGWSGVLVDPSPIAFVKLMQNYAEAGDRADLVNIALAPRLAILKFNATGDALSSFNEEHCERWRKAYDVPFQRIYIRAVTPRELFAAFPGKYDFVSIDVEGENWSLVQTIDFSILSASMLCIEHEDHRNEIRDYCARFGFTVHHVTGENTIMVRA